MEALSQRMADFALGLKYDDIPEPARNEAKRFLLDSLGCALAAVKNEDMQAMYRFTQKLGGIEEATVIGVDWQTNAPNAALMNGLLIRALDYNDIYWVQDPSHPSDLLGTAMAAAEVNPCNGRDLITAIVLAYELEMRDILFERQKTVTVRYKGRVVGTHRLDFVVDGKIVLELKAASTLTDVFKQQTLSYLKATGLRLGILINFGTPRVKYIRIAN